MALLDTEGFGASTNVADFINYGLLPQASEAVISTGGPLGDNYLSIGGYNAAHNSTATLRPLASGLSTFFCGMRLRTNYNGNSYVVFFNDVNGNTQLSVAFNPISSQISLYRGNLGTLLGTSYAGVFPNAAWFYLEVGATIAGGTGGSAIVRVAGIPVLTLAGINTQGYSGDTTFTNVVWQAGSSLTNLTLDVAHYYVCDGTGAAPWNTFLGDVRVQTLLPTGAGASTQFTPHGLASNYQNAAVVPPVPGTDFNQSATVGTTDTFTCPNMAASDTTVLGVQVKALLLKSDAGVRAAATVLKSGATSQQGTAVGLSVSPQYLRTMYATDPNTAAQWTQAGVNAAQPGYTITS